MKVTTGVSQGSVLGFTLRNVFYNTVLQLELYGEASTVAYADDLAMVVVAVLWVTEWNDTDLRRTRSRR